MASTANTATRAARSGACRWVIGGIVGRRGLGRRDPRTGARLPSLDDRAHRPRGPRRHACRRRRRAAPGSGPDRPNGPRVVPPRRNGLSRSRASGRRCVSVVDRRHFRAPPAGQPASSGRGSPRCRHRPVGRCRRYRRRAHDRHDPPRSRPRDRRRQPLRGHPARSHQCRTEGGRRGRGPVLRPGSGELRELLHRGKPRHQRRRPVLREIRPDPRFRAQPGGRAGRWDGDPDRRSQRQGRGRVQPHPPVRGQSGDARDHHRGDAPASDRAGGRDPRSSFSSIPWMRPAMPSRG